MTTSRRGCHVAPADLARTHTLQDLALYAQGLADRAAASAAATPQDREYLAARARTAASVAERLRNSPGYRHE